MLQYKSPLSWPSAIPVTSLTQQRNDSGFSANVTLTDALTFLDDELMGFGIRQAVLYLDMEQPQVERLRKKVGSRTGACLHVKYREHGYIFTCDRWSRMEHNIYALHLAFRQWATMEKWGIGSLSALMAGFEADRTPDMVGTSGDLIGALKSFGLGETATLDDATAIYRSRAKTFAQDAEKLTKLNIEMDEIRAYFANKDK